MRRVSIETYQTLFHAFTVMENADRGTHSLFVLGGRQSGGSGYKDLYEIEISNENGVFEDIRRYICLSILAELEASNQAARRKKKLNFCRVFKVPGSILAWAPFSVSFLPLFFNFKTV